MTDLPFLALAGRLPIRSPESRVEAIPSRFAGTARPVSASPEITPGALFGFEAGDEGSAAARAAFLASIAGVHVGMPHLSIDDIAFPPHQWFDAALARQIALHLMAHRFAIPKRRIARELERSREAINRALRTVDERMENPDFAQTYDRMADAADEAAKGAGLGRS